MLEVLRRYFWRSPSWEPCCTARARLSVSWQSYSPLRDLSPPGQHDFLIRRGDLRWAGSMTLLPTVDVEDCKTDNCHHFLATPCNGSRFYPSRLLRHHLHSDTGTGHFLAPSSSPYFSSSFLVLTCLASRVTVKPSSSSPSSKLLLSLALCEFTLDTHSPFRLPRC